MISFNSMYDVNGGILNEECEIEFEAENVDVRGLITTIMPFVSCTVSAIESRVDLDAEEVKKIKKNDE